jgi:hypothetical protein
LQLSRLSFVVLLCVAACSGDNKSAAPVSSMKKGTSGSDAGKGSGGAAPHASADSGIALGSGGSGRTGGAKPGGTGSRSAGGGSGAGGGTSTGDRGGDGANAMTDAGACLSFGVECGLKTAACWGPSADHPMGLDCSVSSGQFVEKIVFGCPLIYGCGHSLARMGCWCAHHRLPLLRHPSRILRDRCHNS